MSKVFCCLVLFQAIVFNASAQLFQDVTRFTRQDTLRGSNTPERSWWDVIKYDITVEPSFNTKSIKGTNIISCKALEEGTHLQIDMQRPMNITSITCNNQNLTLVREENVYHVTFPRTISKGTRFDLHIRFEGIPREATNPPWDGGWIWKRDSGGIPWMTVACQGLGASVWYPCKDYQGDEPDSATLSIIVPDSLVAVANGRLRNVTTLENHTTAYTWAVVNPINNYNIVPYIGNYAHWSEAYQGEKGNLDMNYWVLKQDLEKAKKQFTQAPMMMKCFEYWFGPYPFYEDGYKLVETPHLGMEHQSAVAYGNKFANGYLGRDLSGTGWGKKWDYIIVHESGHEWFANNITSKDIADMWIHEGFTCYSEVLYTDCQSGTEAGNDYCIGLRRHILNDKPIIGPYGVNSEGSTDMYYKGANLLHNIRQVIHDDEKFRSILRGLNEHFYHQTVTTADIENYMSEKSGTNLSKIFDQYLRAVTVPSLEYKYADGKISFRWTNCISGFNMPVKVITDKETWIYPEEEWKSVASGTPIKQVDRNFYINSRKM